ncbi:MAG: hypothetical protein M3N98_07515, partial [Actinomycetota bacterium]|nr:hypothetical protein [Actinomycetota bacterium]
MTALAALLGTGIGCGIVVVVWGLQPRPPGAPTHHGSARFDDVWARLARAAVGGVVAALLTRWPAAVAAGMAFGFFAGDLLASQGNRGAQTDRTAAIASW